MNNISKRTNIHIAIQLLLFVLLLVIDRLTKNWAENTLRNADIPVIPGIIEFQYVENSGAAFGIFQNAQWLFYIITVVVILIIIGLYVSISGRLKKTEITLDSSESKVTFKTYKKVIFLNYILVVLCAGAVGNLIDRIVRKYVVDFIYFKIINFPVFNFADICVTLSAAFIIIFFLFIYKTSDNFSILPQKTGKNDDKSEG